MCVNDLPKVATRQPTAGFEPATLKWQVQRPIPLGHRRATQGTILRMFVVVKEHKNIYIVDEGLAAHIDAWLLEYSV